MLGRCNCHKLVKPTMGGFNTGFTNAFVEINENVCQGHLIWTDEASIYYDDTHMLNNGAWVTKNWFGLDSFNSTNIWSDGTHTRYYLSSTDKQYVLNGSIWEEMTWNGLPYPDGFEIWSDGTNIYHTYCFSTYVLNGDTWEVKNWNGYNPEHGGHIWTDGTNIYYSGGEGKQYVLNGDTWEVKNWGGFTGLYGGNIWTDGTNIYHSSSDKCHVLLRTGAKIYQRLNGKWGELCLLA